MRLGLYTFPQVLGLAFWDYARKILSEIKTLSKENLQEIKLELQEFKLLFREEFSAKSEVLSSFMTPRIKLSLGVATLMLILIPVNTQLQKIEIIQPVKSDTEIQNLVATDEPKLVFKYDYTKSFRTRALETIIRPASASENKNRATFFDFEGKEMNVNSTIARTNYDEYNIEIPTNRLPPGEYKVELEVFQDGIYYLQEKLFSYGVLAVNSDKASYLPGEKVHIQLAALRNDGHTICDADLFLEITDPEGNTKTPLVERSGKCKRNNVTNVPDYSSYYTVGGVGEYEVKLTNRDTDYQIVDRFEVVEEKLFDIVRKGPTRIFPFVKYPMSLEITASKDFSGEVVDRVPIDFEIKRKTREAGQYKEIFWEVDLKKGETVTLDYFFDAPDISPFLYVAGPATVGNYEESRQWQIASDADGSGNVSVTPSVVAVSATDQTFTFTFDPTEDMNSGELAIKVPTNRGWSTPQSSSGTAGYTTVSASGNATLGTVIVSADSSTENGWSIHEPDSDACNTTASPFISTTAYQGTGSLACDNNSSTAPDATDAYGYTIATNQDWTVYSEIAFWFRTSSAIDATNGVEFGYDNNAAFGSPNDVNNLGTVAANTWTYFKFPINNGVNVRVVGLRSVGNGFDNRTVFMDEILVGPAPHTYIANGSDMDIRLRFVDLASTETVTITYGDGGGTSGADVPVSSGVDEFTTRTRTDAGGTLTNVSDHPDISVQAPAIDISGTCKQSNQSTNCTDTGTLRVAVNGSLQAQTQATVAGTWTISGVTPPNSGDIVTVFIDGAGETSEAVGVTKYDGSGNITGISLIEERLSIGSDDNQTLTNANLSQYDNSVSSDEDIFFDVSVGNDLTMIETSKIDPGMYLKTGNTYRPDSGNSGDVTTRELDLIGTLTLDSNTITLTGGGTPMVVSGTLNEDSSTFRYTSTSTTTVVPETYHHLILAATSGGPTYTLGSGSFDINGNLTIGDGTNTVGINWDTNDPSINVAGNFVLSNSTLWFKSDSAILTMDGATSPVNLTDNNSTKQNLGRITIDGSKEVDMGSSITVEKMNVTTSDTLDMQSSGYELTITGSGVGSERPFIVVGNLTEGSNSLVKYTGSSNTEIDEEVYHDLTMDYSGTTFSLPNAANITITGDLNIQNGTFDAGSSLVVLNNSGSPLIVGDTFTASSSTLQFNGTSSTTIPAVNYYNLEINRTFNGSANTYTPDSGTINIANNLLIGFSSGGIATFDVNANDTDINITGDLIIYGSGNYSASSNSATGLNIQGDLQNSGAFTHNSGVVSFDAGKDSEQSLSGTTTFYDLNIEGGDRSITLTQSNTFAIDVNGSLSLTGDDCENMIRLRTASTGVQATIDVDSSATATVSHIDFQDIAFLDKSITAVNSSDSGNNTGTVTISASGCMGTSDQQDASGYAFQRKVIYDSENDVYWGFYHDGEGIEIKYSTDGGSTWDAPTTEASGHLAYDTNDFSVWWKSISTTEYVIFAVNDGGDIKLRQGTLGTNDITWDGDVSTALTDTGDYAYPYITLDSSNYIWVGARYDDGSNKNFQTAVSGQTVNTDPSTWTWEVKQLSDNVTSSNVYGTIEALSSQDMYATFVVDTDLFGCKWDSTSTQWVDSTDASCETVVSSGAGDTEGSSVRGSGPVKIDDAGDPGTMPGFGRHIVQTSTGVLYSFINDGGSCEIWKSSDGSSWSEQDSTNNPTCISGEAVAISLDSADNLHLVFVQEGVSKLIIYNSFNTATDSFGTEATVNDTSSSGNGYELAIDVDFNNKLHVVLRYVSSNTYIVRYVNNVPGYWNSAVTLHNLEFNNAKSVDIIINRNNVPEVTFTTFGALMAQRGNQNNATIFGGGSVVTAISDIGSMAHDKFGNLWIAYVESDGTLSLARHNIEDSWSTWSTITTNTNVATSPTITTIEDTIAVFYQDDSSDQRIVYDLYNPVLGTWEGETALASTASVDYQTVRVRYSNINHREPWLMDYLYSDGTDVYWNYVDLRPVKIDDVGNLGSVMDDNGRQILRDSAGSYYQVNSSSGTDDVEVWKSSDGYVWRELDSLSKPTCEISCLQVSAAIDSNDVIHIVYIETAVGVITDYDVEYIQLTDGLFGNSATVFDGGTAVGTSNRILEVDIAVDASNVPHVVYDHNTNNIYYDNREGGAWNGTGTTVESVDPAAVSISINDNDIPEIAYVNNTDSDLTAAVGNVNDATSFTLHDVDTSVATSTVSIDIDKLTGDTWIGYIDSDNTVALATHTGSTWSTNWSTITSKTDVGNNPAIAIAGEGEIYVFYEEDNDDIAYDMYNSGATSPSWLVSEVVLHTGTFQYTKVQSSFRWNNFGVSKIPYIFSDGTDVYWDYLYLKKEPVKIDDLGDPETFPGMGSRVIRTSEGIVYVVFNDGGKVEVWRSLDGKSFIEQDIGEGPGNLNSGDELAAAIDSKDVLHIGYVDNSDPEDIYYTTFNTKTNQFSASSEVAINMTTSGNSFRGIDIVLDDNDIPHVVGSRYGTANRLHYSNRIGGSWGSTVDVYTGVNMFKASMAMSEDNVPEIAFFDASNNYVIAALGNANNATSFSTQEVDSTVFSTNTIQATDIAIDSLGNTWITYVDGTNQYINIVKHNDSDAWSSWQTPSSSDIVGSTPSLSIVNDEIYILFENEFNSLVKITYDGSNWISSEEIEEHAALQDVKVGWSYYNDYDSLGIASNQLNTYYFDASDSGPSDPNSVWTNDENAYNGDETFTASSTTIGSTSSNYLLAEGTNAPASGGTIQSVKLRMKGTARSGDLSPQSSNSYVYTNGLSETLGNVSTNTFDFNGVWSNYVTLSTPTGGWSWDKIQSLEVKNYCWSDSDLGVCYIFQVEILVESLNSNSQEELDYVFSDGTDIYYNKYSMGSASSPGSYDEIATGLSGTTYQNFSTIKRNISSTDYIHLAYVNSSGNIYYDRYDGDWDFTASQVSSDTDNSYLSLSTDTSTNDLYLGSIRSSNDDVYTTKATYSAGPSWSWGTSSTLRMDANEIYTNFTQNYSGAGQIGGILSVGDGSPFMLGWETVLASSGNNDPTVTGVTVNGASNINLSAGTTIQVDWTATVTDTDSYTDISSVQGKLYRSGVVGAETCTPNNANCYTDASCQLSGCTGNSCTATCSADLYFFADATDTGTYGTQYWRGWVEATDSQSATGEEFSSVGSPDVNSLNAVDVDPEIDYGTVITGDNSLEKIVTITNTGNVTVDAELSGDDLCTDYPTCASTSINVGNQEYSLNSFTYGSGTDLTSSAVEATLGLSKATTSPSDSTDSIYWRLGIPSVIGTGIYNGENIITSVPQ